MNRFLLKFVTVNSIKYDQSKKQKWSPNYRKYEVDVLLLLLLFLYECKILTANIMVPRVELYKNEDL